MKTLSIILTYYLSSLVLFIVLAIRSRFKSQDRDPWWQTFLFVLLAAAVWPLLLIYLAAKKVNYDRPRPVKKKLRKSFKRDTIIYKNRTMALSHYNELKGKNLSLEDIYGRKYVDSLTPENIAEMRSGVRLYKNDDPIVITPSEDPDVL